MNIAEITFTNQGFDTKIVDVYSQIIRFFDDSIIYPWRETIVYVILK